MKGMTPDLGSTLMGLCAVFPPFCPLNVLFFRVVGQIKTSTPLQASANTDMKLGQRINAWWELVY